MIGVTATQARERYERDERFRRMAQSIVAHVLNEHGRVNPDEADREVHDIALKVASLVIETMFQNDGELLAQRELAERYRKLAEDALAFSPPKMFVPLTAIAPQQTPQSGAVPGANLSLPKQGEA